MNDNVCLALTRSALSTQCSAIIVLPCGYSKVTVQAAVVDGGADIHFGTDHLIDESCLVQLRHLSHSHHHHWMFPLTPSLHLIAERLGSPRLKLSCTNPFLHTTIERTVQSQISSNSTLQVW